MKRSTKRTNKKEALMVELATKKRILDGLQFGDCQPITLREAVEEWWQLYGSRLRDAPRIEGNIRVMLEILRQVDGKIEDTHENANGRGMAQCL